MRKLITLLTLCACLPCLTWAQPNILLIVVDDMGYSDLSCFGSEIPTPNLDKLAQDGLKMRQFYNSAKCEPSRSMIISGQHWHDCGMKIKKGPTMGEILRSANYNTYAVGKWHLIGNPIDRGFDHYFGHLNGATNYFKGDPSFRLDKSSYIPPTNFYATSAYANYAIKFIEDGHKVNPDKRFFMYLAHSAPHAPLMALPEDIERFKDTYKVGWDKIRENRIKRQLDMSIIDSAWPIPPRPENIPSWKSLSEKEREAEAHRMAVYAAMLYRVDISIGLVINKLEELGLRDNTLIVFISDNGANPFDRGRTVNAGPLSHDQNYGLGWAFTCNTPYRLYKQNQHNGGACTSAIFNWPDVIHNNGNISDYPGQILDLMPTFIDLACAKYPKTYDGKPLKALPGESLKPLLTGKKMTNTNPMYFHLYDNAAIIEDNWKLVRAFGNKWELYNLSNDRAEVNDLINQEPKKARELQTKWEAWFGNNKLETFGDKPEYIHLSESEK